MVSAPPTPPSHDPQNRKNYRFHGNGAPCEWIEAYYPGSFHPVHLGDVFQDRYEVIRKLGNGSLGTVWLALDRQRVYGASKYVALKFEISSRNNPQELDILRMISTQCANDPDAENIFGIIDSFVHQGPNGNHQCLVSRPMGPSVSSLMNRPPDYLTRFPKDQAQRILRAVLQGIRFLHAKGIVHGDLQSGNFLFFIQDVDSVSHDGLRQDESGPGVTFVRRRDGKVDKWAPRYLIEAKPLSRAEVTVLDDRVGICDFGGAFSAEQPPQSIVTPIALRAPETILRDLPGPAVDIWSFGCLLYEYLTGEALFQIPPLPDRLDEVKDDDHLIQLSEILGPLPPHFLHKWPRADRYFEANGQRKPAAGNPIDLYMDARLGCGDTTNLEEVVVSPPPPFDSLEKRFHNNKPSDFDDDGNEENTIVALLRSFLRHDPRERPSASYLLEHAWFKEEAAVR